MWKHRKDVAREIAEVLSEHLASGVRVIGVGEHGEVMAREARLVLKMALRDDADVIFILKDGIAKLEEIAPTIIGWREKGMKRIVVGVGVMPSHLIEPVKRLVDELFVLKIPRLFQNVGQYFEGVD